jgi:hypothetical protein
LVTIDESSRIERNKSTIVSVGTPRFADRDTSLQGPIVPRLIGLAFPILIVLAVQTLVSVGETYFVGFLGDEALAGVALVFPILMLMTMMSNGGIGGGVASLSRAPSARAALVTPKRWWPTASLSPSHSVRCSPLRYWALVKRCSVHSAAAA